MNILPNHLLVVGVAQNDRIHDRMRQLSSMVNNNFVRGKAGTCMGLKLHSTKKTFNVQNQNTYLD